jgi:hypothetical protein
MSNVDFEFLPHRAALLAAQDNTLDVLGRAAAPERDRDQSSRPALRTPSAILSASAGSLNGNRSI